MKVPRELVRIATLGTENSKSSSLDSTSSVVKMIRERAHENGQRQLLNIVGGLSFQRMAGWIPPICNDELEPPCQIDSRKVINRQTIQHLMTMLSRQFKELLPHSLEIIRRHDLKMPPEALPKLLEIGRTNKSLRDLIVSVIGQRGEWISEVAVEEDWRWFMPHHVFRTWENGTNTERADLIQSLRKTDPAQARSFVVGVWDKVSSEQKLLLLSTFRINLNLNDEEFLENALDDRSNEVQGIAIDLLAQLPGSRFRQRMAERSLSFLEYDAQRKTVSLRMKVILNHKKMLRRDGLRDRDLGFFVHSVLRFVDPAYYCDQWEISLEDFFKAVQRNKRQSSKLWELMVAGTITAKNTAAADILMGYICEVSYNTQYWRAFINKVSPFSQSQYSEDWKELLKIVSPSVRQDYVLKIMQYKPMRFSHKFNAIIQLLASLETTWDESIPIEFIHFVLRINPTWQDANNPQSDFCLLLRRFAGYIPNSMIDECLTLLGKKGSPYVKAHTEFQRYLEFSQRMLAAIDASTLNIEN